MRRAARTDDNQRQIVNALRSIPGCVVKPVHGVKGFVDLVIGYQGRTILMEVKDGSKPKSQQKLTNMEQAFHDTWTGGPLVVCRSVDEAIKHVLSGRYFD